MKCADCDNEAISETVQLCKKCLSKFGFEDLDGKETS